MAVSLAALRVLETDAGVDLARDVAFVAGHSLGEYSALAAAQSLTIADAARLLRIRGRAMQKAVPVGAGAMAALIGVDLAQARAIAAEAGGICAAANDNGSGQVVLSGETKAVERAVEVAKAKGVKRAMMLPVSAPFHCPLMRPAAEAMAEALSTVAVRPPRVPLIANVRAEPISDPTVIVRSLIEQVTDTVRWRESVLFMVQAGVTTFYEVGAGKVLAGLIRRIAETAKASSIGTPEDIIRFKTERG
jgi:[acyl-carrier-protein] S-malonyltransferase